MDERPDAVRPARRGGRRPARRRPARARPRTLTASARGTHAGLPGGDLVRSRRSDVRTETEGGARMPRSAALRPTRDSAGRPASRRSRRARRPQRRRRYTHEVPFGASRSRGSAARGSRSTWRRRSSRGAPVGDASAPGGPRPRSRGSSGRDPPAWRRTRARRGRHRTAPRGPRDLLQPAAPARVGQGEIQELQRALEGGGALLLGTTATHPPHLRPDVGQLLGEGQSLPAAGGKTRVTGSWCGHSRISRFTMSRMRSCCAASSTERDRFPWAGLTLIIESNSMRSAPAASGYRLMPHRSD